MFKNQMPSEISQTRHARRKQMFSALPPEADVSRPFWNVRSVPSGDILHRRKVVEFFRYRDAMLLLRVAASSRM